MFASNRTDDLAPPLAPVIAEALDQSLQLSEWIQEHFPRECPASERNVWAMRLFGLALDHREAILLLVRHNARSSAYALVRPMYEASMRGLWVTFAATEPQIEGLANHHPKFDTVIRQLNRAKDLHPGGFHALNVAAWESFSDYSHGGARQLSRWQSEGGIGPVHPDQEVPQLLDLVDCFATLVCMGALTVAGKDLAPLVARFGS